MSGKSFLILLRALEGYDRNVDNYVKQIRRKLADGVKTGGRIETVHGVGYRYLP